MRVVKLELDLVEAEAPHYVLKRDIRIARTMFELKLVLTLRVLRNQLIGLLESLILNSSVVMVEVHIHIPALSPDVDLPIGQSIELDWALVSKVLDVRVVLDRVLNSLLRDDVIRNLACLNLMLP